MIGVSECAANLGAFQWMALVLAGLFWTFRLFKFFYQFFQFWDIKMFYNTALKIEDVSRGAGMLGAVFISAFPFLLAGRSRQSNVARGTKVHPRSAVRDTDEHQQGATD